MCRTVLKCLERTDGLTKLLAGGDVVDRLRKTLLC